MSCKPIIDFTLDEESREALERISHKKQLSKLLGVAISVGVFNSIFTKNKAPVAAFNVSQTDWNLYGKAVAALPTIQRKAIEKEIDLMIIHYQLGQYDHKHVQFWKGMKNGCQ